MRQHTLVRRQHPIFSPVAIISTLLLAGALSVMVFLRGGGAFSPGDLSDVNHNRAPMGGFFTHAEFGGDCNYCHTPFKGVEAARCETCHENVGRERQTETGLHGRLQMTEACAECHLDHRGSDFNLLTLALSNFNHEVTRFSLAKHERDYGDLTIECNACHVGETDYAVVQTACAACHQTADPPFMTLHRKAYGDDCLRCHDGLDTMAQFSLDDHADVFALAGVHLETACENCHKEGQFEGTPQECVACHEEPETHLGLFGVDCAACHTAKGWTPATVDGKRFDHAADTRFSLVLHTTNYDNASFACNTCHVSGDQFIFTDAQCTDCHEPADPQFIADHIAQFGPDCMDCHDGTGEMANFDHALVWPLEGQHAVIECTDCHVNQVFKGTSGECIDCHEEPVIHAGVFGIECANCHSANAWAPARLTQHNFPLDHGERGEIACEVCHTATYTEYTCYNCHDHDQGETERKHLEEGISREEIVNCVECHPTGRENEAESDD